MYHSLALGSDGTVAAWGTNADGQSQAPTGLDDVIGIAAGAAHSLALVSIFPRITPPASQTAEAGSRVVFGASSAGSQKVTYRWLFNGTNIQGEANSALCLARVQPTQAGAYTLVVSNQFGAITAAAAMLSVIPPVERRTVPALNLQGEPGSLLHLDYRDDFGPAGRWLSLSNLTLTSTVQSFFDLSQPPPAQRFYRAWQASGPRPTLDLNLATEVTLSGTKGGRLRIDYINQIGPTNVWLTLDTVNLTNTTQLYFDLTAFRRPARLYRLVAVP
jgi:hypothetical protein